MKRIPTHFCSFIREVKKNVFDSDKILRNVSRADKHFSEAKHEVFKARRLIDANFGGSMVLHSVANRHEAQIESERQKLNSLFIEHKKSAALVLEKIQQIKDEFNITHENSKHKKENPKPLNDAEKALLRQHVLELRNKYVFYRTCRDSVISGSEGEPLKPIRKDVQSFIEILKQPTSLD
ncbi:MAG: hypothetical protein WC408_01680 [Candidatus Micrarchaeia archaeon]|jgi:hypothetical protein